MSLMRQPNTMIFWIDGPGIGIGKAVPVTPRPERKSLIMDRQCPVNQLATVQTSILQQRIDKVLKNHIHGFSSA